MQPPVMSNESSILKTLTSWLLPPAVGTVIGAGVLVGFRGPMVGQPPSPVPVMVENPPAEQASSSPRAVMAAVRPSQRSVASVTAGDLLVANEARERLEAERRMLKEAVEEQWKERVRMFNGRWQPMGIETGEFLRGELLSSAAELPAMYLAVLNGDPEWIRGLAVQGLDPDVKTPAGDTPLCAAVRLSEGACAKALLDVGADPSLPGIEGQPPIVLASLQRSAGGLEALLEAGVDPNTRLPSPVAKELIDKVVIRDLKWSLANDRGLTPLMCCAARGDVEGAVALMKAGAKTNVYTSRYKKYPINFAAVQGYLFLMRVILGRDPESEPDVLVTIDLSQQKAWVEKNGKILDSTTVSTGKKGYSTPAGRYVITDKHKSWTSTIYHVAMPYFQRLNCGSFGMHSGYVTGRPASHGCIRLPYSKAKSFFSLTKVGDEVQIVP